MIATENALLQGFDALGLTLDPAPFCYYLERMQFWNKTHNLTAIRDMDSMVTKHILDSLAIAPWLLGERIIDVGTGAGLPGIPLALAYPEWHFTLLDARSKKTDFLRDVQCHLNLKHVEIIHSRVEDFQPEKRFNTIVTRAFSQLLPMVSLTEHLIDPQGQWLAMKGQPPIAELTDLSRQYTLHHYAVPGQEAQRCCIIIEH